MHRSGTSLVSGWLAHCGLDIGDEYYEPTYGNPRGHYEDLLFVGFHKSVLKRHGISFSIPPGKVLNISAQETREAYSLMRERSGRPQWGWKDPRTTLFLEFWRARFLQLRVLGMYRPYNGVVYSLMRRDLRQPAGPLKKAILPLWHQTGNLLLANRYLGTWIRYNQALLDHAAQYPEEVLLVRADRLEADASFVHQFITHRWGFHLQPEPLSAVFVPEEFEQFIPDIRYSKSLKAQAESIWEQLENARFIQTSKVQPARQSAAKNLNRKPGPLSGS